MHWGKQKGPTLVESSLVGREPTNKQSFTSDTRRFVGLNHLFQTVAPRVHRYAITVRQHNLTVCEIGLEQEETPTEVSPTPRLRIWDNRTPRTIEYKHSYSHVGRDIACAGFIYLP